MYIGFLSEQGKIVRDCDAFAYAVSRCAYQELGKQEFLKEFSGSFSGGLNEKSLELFKVQLVEWFFSGNWIYQKGDIELC